MDIFQLIGDFLHLMAVLMLVLKILANRNVLGLSYKTQQIFLVVFLLRYIDIFTWRTLYLFAMKILFISLTAYTIYLIRFKRPFNLSYDKEHDSFPHYYIYLGALVLTVLVHRDADPSGLIWSYSIWLEAGAILPQLALITKLKQVQNITAHYVFFLGMYRLFYVFHWIFRWDLVIWTSFLAGILQSVFYADFIYYFIKSNQNDRLIQLPL